MRLEEDPAKDEYGLRARFAAAVTGCMTEALIGADRAERIVEFNPAAERLFGYARSEVIGAPLSEVVRTGVADGSGLPRGGRNVLEIECLHRGDGAFPAIATLLEFDLAGDAFTALIVRDLSLVQDVERERRELASAVGHSQEFVFLMDPEGRIVSCNPAFRRITGIDPERSPGPLAEHVLPESEQSAGFHARMWTEIRAGRTFREPFVAQRNNGDPMHVELTIEPVTDPETGVLRYVAVGRDISDRVWTLNRLLELAYLDSLTQLPNRRRFFERLNEALQRARQAGEGVAVLFIDLDGFKQINDSRGHAEGDTVLWRVAERLKGVAKGNDTVARLGGDEFLVLRERVETQASSEIGQITDLVQEVFAALEKPILVGDEEFQLTASIGISYYTHGDMDAETLLRQADLAMNQAKQAGENSYRFHAPTLTEQAAERLQLEQELRKAVQDGNDWHVLYQPLIHLRTRQPIAVEALARWWHPDLGWVSPGRFIPIAEQTGLIRAIGRWILRAACRDLAQWRAAGVPIERVCVNVSPEQLVFGDFVAEVEEALGDHALAPHRLELELTENVFMHGQVEAFEKLRRLGVRTAIDDFGTGYSSLSYLASVPADTLKIDRSFVSGVHNDRDHQAIINAVLALSERLGFELVAEGVEEEAEAALLAEWGCSFAQGFYFARPMPPGEIPGHFER